MRARPKALSLGVAKIDDYQSVNEGGKWRCVTVSHCARYLTQAELTLSVDGRIFTFEDGAVANVACVF